MAFASLRPTGRCCCRGCVSAACRWRPSWLSQTVPWAFGLPWARCSPKQHTSAAGSTRRPTSSTSCPSACSPGSKRACRISGWPNHALRRTTPLIWRSSAIRPSSPRQWSVWPKTGRKCLLSTTSRLNTGRTREPPTRLNQPLPAFGCEPKKAATAAQETRPWRWCSSCLKMLKSAGGESGASESWSWSLTTSSSRMESRLSINQTGTPLERHTPDLTITQHRTDQGHLDSTAKCNTTDWLEVRCVSIGTLTTTSELHDELYAPHRSEEHTSELQSRGHLVCRLLLEKEYLSPFTKELDMLALTY